MKLCVHVILGLFILLALAVYTRSPSAYEALKGFNILVFHLSKNSLVVIWKHLGIFRKGCHNPIDDYQTLIQTKKEWLPLGGGVLICDKVMVAMKISWNSRNEQGRRNKGDRGGSSPPTLETGG